MRPLLGLDHAIRHWVVTHRIAALDLPMLVVSGLGYSGIVFFLIGAAYAVAHRMRWIDLVRLGLALAAAVLVTDHVLKPAIGRARPFTAVTTVRVIGHEPDDSSFPSGHAAASGAGATALSLLLPAGVAVWWTIAAVVIYSRIYIGVHYPLDVAGGAIVGATIAAAVLWMTKRRTT